MLKSTITTIKLDQKDLKDLFRFGRDGKSPHIDLSSLGGGLFTKLDNVAIEGTLVFTITHAYGEKG
jgi:hypothetical protein